MYIKFYITVICFIIKCQVSFPFLLKRPKYLTKNVIVNETNLSKKCRFEIKNLYENADISNLEYFINQSSPFLKIT